jgi:putative transposase
MAGFVFHVLNRGARRGVLFETAADYDAFVRVLRQAIDERPIRLLNFCAMRNHFHLLVWPETDQQLPRFMHWLTATHGLRWRDATGTIGEGAVYQGRYKAIPVQTDDHFLRVARYVERNPVRAGLVARAQDWRWSSLWHREVARSGFPLADWPIDPPIDWTDHVNRPQTLDELAAIRRCVIRGCAVGDASWQKEVAKSLGIPGYFRSVGRPRANDS